MRQHASSAAISKERRNPRGASRAPFRLAPKGHHRTRRERLPLRPGRRDEPPPGQQTLPQNGRGSQGEVSGVQAAGQTVGGDGDHQRLAGAGSSGTILEAGRQNQVLERRGGQKGEGKDESGVEGEDPGEAKGGR